MNRRATTWSAFAVFAIWTSSLFAQAADEPVAVLQGDQGVVSLLAYSPDGETLASVGTDKSIKLWEVATSKVRATLEGHTEPITSMVYSRDGKMIVSGSAESSIKLWDPSAAKELATLDGFPLGVTSLAFSPDGKILAAVGLVETDRGEFKLWDWDGAASKERAAAPREAGGSPSFSPDGRTLAYVNGGGVKLWAVDEGKELESPKVQQFVAMISVAFSPDGELMGYGGGMKNRPTLLRVWDIALKKDRFDPGGQHWGLGHLVFSPDGKALATWAKSYDQIEEIKLWDSSTGKERAKIQTTDVSAVAFSPDSKELAVAEGNAGIKIWAVPE